MNLLAMLLLLSNPEVSFTASVQTFVEAPGPSGPLKGTMLSSKEAGAPIALIIPGSGPTDRDGNNPLGVRGAPLKLLAEGLAANGVATVRIDKRGMFGSALATANLDSVTISDYAADVHSWVTSIRSQTEAKCIWLIGHSEGGLVALAASQDRSDICGLVLVSAVGRPMGMVLAEQLKANPANGPILDQAVRAITELEAGRHIDSSKLHPALSALFNPAVQDFLIDVMVLDPAELIATLDQPVLIFQGARDIQVNVLDAELLKKANNSAQLVIVPDTNHVLKTVTSDDRATNLVTYADPSLPLAPSVTSTISQFIKSSGN